ncbi:alpha/beta hydrolase-fold protein [Acidianus manzaensis]|uniref:Hydrolase n=1 Tax=Acidianus manzaensis TaxID=282676 RepID=A0A1W6K2P6_9CREN|nr:alpha/beta hydrolase-fold protein [Acidianus manzaensis]ARM76732.1 hydrolase [Acidianus manzaensis]
MKYEIIKIESESLKDNYLGDPYTREVLIYTPDIIDDNLPLFIELAGINWSGNVNNRFHQIMKNIIDKKGIRAVFANPNFRTRYSLNQYINSPAVGNYEDFIIKELIPILKEKYHTREVVLFGKSSGGFGAYTLAVNHPDVIQAFADHFGDSCFYFMYASDFILTIKNLYGKRIEDILNLLFTKKDLTDDDIKMLNVFGSSAFYSYNLDSKVGFDLPFDIETGELIEDIWKKWLSHDPVRNVEKFKDNLKKLKAIYLDVGKDDEFNLFIGMKSLHKKMSNLEIDHYYEEFKGGHFGNSNRYCKSIPYIYNKLQNFK